MEELNRTNTQRELENLRKEARSYWRRGVIDYAIELLDNVDNWESLSLATLEETLLNGASRWAKYSDGGCALSYNEDIADRLCTPSQLKRKKGGELPPNSHEDWLDVQTRALTQAYYIIRRVIRKKMKEKPEKLEEDISFEDIIKKLNDSDGDFVLVNDEEGNPFLIVYDWKDAQALQKVIKPDFEPKDKNDTSVFDELKNIGWGFADEWAKCDECEKLIRTSPDSCSFKPDYWVSDEHGILLCGDCVRNNHDVSLEYVRTMINNAKKANTILGENELKELGFTLIDEDFENGWYDRHDNPEEILETALEKHPEGAFIFSISGVGQFEIQFELWGVDLEKTNFLEEFSNDIHELAEKIAEGEIK